MKFERLSKSLILQNYISSIEFVENFEYLLSMFIHFTLKMT